MPASDSPQMLIGRYLQDNGYEKAGLPHISAMADEKK